MRLALRGGRIARVLLHSTRPDIAATLLTGRTPQQLMAAVPRLFSVCGASQDVACRLAQAAAAGTAPDAATLAQCSAEVGNEIVRESTRRALLDAPRHIGEAPHADALQAARKAMQWPALGGDAATAIGMAVFGMRCDAWLALDTPEALAAWVDAGATATSRELQPCNDDHGTVAALLPATDPAEHIADWLPAPGIDAHFAQRPLWRGQPAETGALARLQADPLVSALVRQNTSRVRTRHVARLRELAQLLCGAMPALAGVLATPVGDGVAWVENARGLLVHQLRLADGISQAYRIVAPTEWNFHPDGAIALALRGTPAADAGEARRRAERLIDSLDPCVDYHVECFDA